jgi:hypothetical protein
VGLIQNIIEGHGIATTSITLKPELTERMRVPRAAYVRYPYGNALGMPGDAETQRAIMRDALGLIYDAPEPGLIAQLPYRWRGRTA